VQTLHLFGADITFIWCTIYNCLVNILKLFDAHIIFIWCTYYMYMVRTSDFRVHT